jgi:hypothetical protein
VPKKQRVAGSTYTYTTGTTGGPVTLGNLKGIPVGHRVYLVNILNTDASNSVQVGSDLTSDYTLIAGSAKDFYFVDPANIQILQLGNAVKLNIDVSGEFPGTCPKCDQADG